MGKSVHFLAHRSIGATFSLGSSTQVSAEDSHGQNVPGVPGTSIGKDILVQMMNTVTMEHLAKEYGRLRCTRWQRYLVGRLSEAFDLGGGVVN